MGGNPETLTNAAGVVVFEGTTSESGGSQPVMRAEVNVSSPEILDLAATPKTIVAAVTGKIIVGLALTVVYVPGETPYTDGGGELSAGISPNYPDSGGSFLQTSGFPTAGFWDQATEQFLTQNYGAGVALFAGAAGVGPYILGLGPAGAPTDGDGTLKVTLIYYLADIS